ncbi:MAG: 2-oxoacid:acceptor oxidoreductase subunit alpha, partial [Halanaerobiaceae bacterium]
MDLNLVIGGEAGQGLKTTSYILGKAIFRMNYNIFTSQDYMSRIRGGHNFVKIRFGDNKINGPEEKIDLLIALNEKTIEVHKNNLADNGIILWEEKRNDLDSIITIPAREIASEINIKGINTVYMGAALKLIGLDLKKTIEVIETYFAKEDIIKDNIELLKAGYEEVETKIEMKSAPEKDEEFYMNGNQAIAAGAILGEVQFYSAYPMSPSTGIMSYLSGKQPNMNLVVEQAEDEIGAINMALGASYGGIRAMTGTSGGGFALMAEGVGLAGITETPLVIAEVQRPGPATGLPTRTEQGDLSFVINVSQGEFPLMVTAPRDQEDALNKSFRALNLAEKYQIPVVLLSDQFLADSSKNIPELDLENMENKNYKVDPEDYQNKEYKRYEITESGISPLAYPGLISDQTVLVDSDEHDEKGHIIEDAETRNKMVEKRKRKQQKLIEDDLEEPKYFGESNIDYMLISWGSTYGPVLEALELLKDEKIAVGYLSFTDVWPLPRKKINNLLDKEIEIVVIENNSTGQFARLITGETGIKINHNILKYDGRPFTGK